ncbi:MAG: nickel-dependent hydrogenase large subunit [Elusimicrobiota bacterium]|nr:nickel-dependent hydrogenase large subunit [Elusimicrobiota bacterium]MDH5662087.1 nickel-dependent hydrogenase large subunit [Elusimicrobiota bacterium]
MAKTIIPVGPYHPLQEEPEFFKLLVEGEKVLELEIELGYNHRGIEKIAESKSYDQVIFLVERVCGICSTSHPIASVNALEDLAGIRVPERALYIRSIIGEMERLHSHLLWLGLAGHFIGYNTVWMWAWKYREPVLDIFERITGNRQHYAMMKVGGVRRDIESDDIPGIWKMVDGLLPALDMFKGAVMDDPVIHARLKGVGILTKEDVVAYGAVGPTARASGVAIDVRKDDPYAAYPLVDWQVITQEEGDVFAKAVVRILEMYESIKIVKGCLDKLKLVGGEIDAKVKEIPPGEGIGRHEAPRGEVFHYVRSDGSNRPVRYKVRAPSYMNVPTNQKSVVGGTVSDATITLAAVDPCYCCTERVAVVDRKTGRKGLTGQELIKLSQEKTLRIKKEMVV